MRDEMTVSTECAELPRMAETTAPILRNARWADEGIYERIRGILGYDVRAIDRPEQAWFWTETWQAKEREADEDVALGRTTVCRSNDDFLAFFEDAD